MLQMFCWDLFCWSRVSHHLIITQDYNYEDALCVLKRQERSQGRGSMFLTIERGVWVYVCVCAWGGVHPLYQPKLVYMPNNFVICSLDLDLKWPEKYKTQRTKELFLGNHYCSPTEKSSNIKWYIFFMLIKKMMRFRFWIMDKHFSKVYKKSRLKQFSQP